MKPPLIQAQTHAASFSDLCPEPRPKLFGVGRFRSPADDIPRPFGSAGKAYMVVALTRLSAADGMLVFCRPADGGHSPCAGKWQEEEVELEAGDAVVWRGECLTKRGNGHGGTVLFIEYQKPAADR